MQVRFQGFEEQYLELLVELLVPLGAAVRLGTQTMPPCALKLGNVDQRFWFCLLTSKIAPDCHIPHQNFPPHP